MAVPKKRKSKSRANSQNHVWKREIVKQARRAVSLAKALLGGNTNFLLVSPGPTTPIKPNPKKQTGRRPRSQRRRT
uniref:Large ribosomal subunit protein bL32c n=1 Tax=Nephroselmis olivacea TaxID=31312 RepID=RK32_NEPOL|nr:ribosomal protein L32 [Nephroselmis olivacea]Q9TKU9.1 RecName: Full=Large ribosomal subunit protein bL32c; AltName: Full=50S ribosomal protein L32, chloroplastic [Nephroselmis olivacea]AAD54898.1 ribosomal protein L32 [Nephroselmis olivacea]